MKRKILFFIFIIYALFTAYILHSQWVRQNYPSQKQVHSIHFIDTLHGWMCASNMSPLDTALILYTSNGGNNWVKQYSVGSSQFYRIRFANLNTGYCAGAISNNIFETFLKTTNSGFNWFVDTTPPSTYFNDIAVINADTIYGCISGSFVDGIYKSVDGGINFTRTYNTQTSKLFFTDYNHGWGVVGGFYLVHTTDAGGSWATVGSFASNSINYVFFIDNNTGWLTYGSGNNNKILKSINGGINWTIIDSGVTTSSYGKYFNHIYFINTNTGWCLGSVLFQNPIDKPIVLKTTSGGFLWNTYQNLTDSAVSTVIQFIDSLHGWAYGYWSKGNYTNNGGGPILYLGINNDKKFIPNKFYLYQNYPNPFNPQTMIRFSLLRKSFVILKIYDAIGKEISNWNSNNILEPGIHEIQFKPDNISSGIYFYQLTVKDASQRTVFTDTKKLILLK